MNYRERGESESRIFVCLLKRLLILAICLCPILAGKTYAEGTVHALVINGRPLNASSSGKIYTALTYNKLPGYSTSGANIHQFSYEVSSKKKHTTNEAFLAAIDDAFSKSKKQDLNIIYYGGHGAHNGIPTWMDGEDTKTGIMYTDLAKYLNSFKGKFIFISNACAARAFYTEGVCSLKNGDAKFLCLSATNQVDVSIGNLFPNRIIKGIGYDSFQKAPADGNKDGMFSADELISYTTQESLLGKTYLDGTGSGSGTPVFQFTYLELNKTKMTLNADTKKTGTLKVTLERHAEGVSREVIWKSSDEKIVSVSEKSTKSKDGTHSITLTPHKTGKATITAYLNSSLGKCSGTEVTCEVEVEDYKSIYKAFLAKGKTTITQNGYSNTLDLTSYCVLDVNQDKIPELIVKSTKPSQGAAFDEHHIYTIRQGKLYYCGGIVQRGTANVYYSKKYKALENSGWTNFVGGTWAHLFQLKGGKIKQYKYIWEGYSDTQNTTYIYYTGNSDTSQKKVSKTAYTNFVNKYFAKGSIKAYKFKRNTAANRKNSFG